MPVNDDELAFTGEVGVYSLSSGDVPVPGSGIAAPPFYPPRTLGRGQGKHAVAVDNAVGAIALYGTPLYHSTQQLLAFFYAKQQIAFGTGSVTFKCHWLWMEPTLFTASREGWIQHD